jgi:hypothetical protein
MARRGFQYAAAAPVNNLPRYPADDPLQSDSCHWGED